ncbi:HAD hydrolase-like protein [Paracoccus cavernae]|uniref:HAD hydrolase-like protein n=1 Tax=Paracoccus cavernae TaxID=1571207 RepID=UPI00362AA140
MNTCLAPCPIVFDLDGTLIDSAPDIQSAANFVLADHDIASLTLDQIRSFIGGGVDILWEKSSPPQEWIPPTTASSSRPSCSFITRPPR